MPGHDIIAVAGQVVELLGPTLVRAELSNGHRVVAHATRHTRVAVGRLKMGDSVRLELSPFDMSTARISGPRDDENENGGGDRRSAGV